jgi:ferredoxin-NADP reductase
VQPYVTDIRRYPVKGLGGESLTSTDIGPRGICWDRALGMPNGRQPLQPPGQWTPFEAFAVLKTRGDIGELSARVEPHGAELHNAESVDILRKGAVIASVPIVDGAPRPSPNHTVGAWIGTDGEAREVFSPGVPLWDDDEAHASIINLATVRSIGAAMGVDNLDPLRFRANIYLDGLEPWEELRWIGCRIRIGDAVGEVFSPIQRCRATSAPPGSNGWDLNLPGALAAHFGHLHNGIYIRFEQTARVQIGDRIAPVGSFHPGQMSLGEPDDAARGPRFVDIVDVEQSTARTVSLTLADPYELLNTAHAGQHLRLHRLDDTPDWRNYTISGGSPAGTRVTVRLEMSGRFSPWATSLRPGDRLAVSGPHGTAHIDSATTRPIVVLTAGIGITPALAIAQSLANAGSTRKLSVLHVDRTEDAVPHLAELSANVQALPHGRLDLFLTAEQRSGYWHHGRPDTGFVRNLIDDAADVSVFICGPKVFLASMTEICSEAGVPRNAILIDPFYSPPSPNLEPREAPNPGPFQVLWPDQTVSTWTPAEGTLLELAEAVGKQPPFGCRAGGCGTCEASVTGETFALVDTFVQPDDGRALLCTSVPTTDLEITSFS